MIAPFDFCDPFSRVSAEDGPGSCDDGAVIPMCEANLTIAPSGIDDLYSDTPSVAVLARVTDSVTEVRSQWNRIGCGRWSPSEVCPKYRRSVAFRLRWGGRGRLSETFSSLFFRNLSTLRRRGGFADGYLSGFPRFADVDLPPRFHPRVRRQCDTTTLCSAFDVVLGAGHITHPRHPKRSTARPQTNR